jgi:hypothetical protein
VMANPKEDGNYPRHPFQVQGCVVTQAPCSKERGTEKALATEDTEMTEERHRGCCWARKQVCVAVLSVLCAVDGSGLI